MHAFVVLAHTDPTMCHRLISRLAPHGPVHLNVNARVDPEPFASSVSLSRLLTPRHPVYWGGWSMVEAVMRLSHQALADPEVDVVTWLSAQHYPLVDPAAIAASTPVDRIALHHAPNAEMGKPDWRFRTRFVSSVTPGTRTDVLVNGLARRLPSLDYPRILGEHRLYAGTAWWSLTRRTLSEAMEWLTTENDIRRYFAKLCVPDEAVFHTAVGAVLTARAVAEGRTDTDPRRMTRGSTTFVRWDGGRHPAELDAEAIRSAADQGWWFARKFVSHREDLLEVAEESWDRTLQR